MSDTESPDALKPYEETPDAAAYVRKFAARAAFDGGRAPKLMPGRHGGDYSAYFAHKWMADWHAMCALLVQRALEHEGEPEAVKLAEALAYWADDPELLWDELVTAAEQCDLPELWRLYEAGRESVAAVPVATEKSTTNE
jgi:hypothetical protein